MSTNLESKVEAILKRARLEILTVLAEEEAGREPPPQAVTAQEQRDGYLDYKGAAEYLSVDERTLRGWVSDVEHTGIPFRKVIKGVRFKRDELDAWSARNALRKVS